MKKLLVLAVVGVAAALDPSAVSEVVPWIYTEMVVDRSLGELSQGPSDWGKLQNPPPQRESVLYPACTATESPINMEPLGNQVLKELMMEFTPTNNYSVINTGRIHRVQFGASPGTLVDTNVNPSKKYNLDGLEFHTPAEHAINGRRYDMEMHMVFTVDGDDASNGRTNQNTAVVSVMFEQQRRGHSTFLHSFVPTAAQPPSIAAPGGGPPRSFMAYATDNVTKFTARPQVVSTGSHTTIDLNDVIVGKDYYSYTGTRTSPPCTTGVTYFVMKDAIPMGSGQLAYLVHQMYFSIEKQVANDLYSSKYPAVADPRTPAAGIAAPNLQPFSSIDAHPGNARPWTTTADTTFYQHAVNLDEKTDNNDEATLLGLLGTLLGVTTFFMVVAYHFMA